MKNDISTRNSLLINEYISTLDNTQNYPKIIEDMYTNIELYFNNQVSLKNITNEVIEYYDIIKKIRKVKDEDFDEIFNQTLEIFEIDKTETILIKSLQDLSKNDKSFYDKDMKCRYLIRLFHILLFLEQHKQKINLWNKLKNLDVLERGTALVRTKNISEIIEPRLNSCNEVLSLSTNKVTVHIKNILSEYENNPLNTDYLLNIINGLNLNKVNPLIQNQINNYYNLRTFLNSAMQIKLEDIYKSAQIYLLQLFNPKSLIFSSFNIKKSSFTKSAKNFNVLMEHYLKMPKSKLNYTHFKKPIQTRTTFFDLEILEYQTKKNYKSHPVWDSLESTELLSVILGR